MLKSILAGAALSLLVATQTSAQQVVLKLNSPAPPMSYLHREVITPWIEAVSKDAGDSLKIQPFFGGTLGNFGNTYDRVIDEVVDIGFILTAFAAGKFPREDVAALPFEADTALIASKALWSIYEKKVTAAEFDAVRPLGMWTFPNAAIHTREPIKSLDDFRGKKLAASSAISAKIVTGLGATPISLRPDEVYTAIQRGTVDGALMPFTGMGTFKIQEQARHHLDVALGSDAAMLFINKKKYDSLPAKARAAIDKHSYAPLSAIFGQKTQDEWQKSRDLVAKDTTTLTREQEAEWKKRLSTVAEDWTRTVPDGAKVLQAFRAEVAAARK
jgi:TRAP-type C4-dicarboxylate transport system substrate-binding protein